MDRRPREPLSAVGDLQVDLYATKLPNRYGINATFLPGHFKGYTVKLNPLDGVYYCDIRPNMSSDPLLNQHIRTIDHFFCTDLWRFVALPGDAQALVLDETKLP